MNPTGPDHQLQSIHAMLVSGHRCVRLDRHTVLLIGFVGGFLTIATDWVVTAERFPDPLWRALVLFGWLAICLGATSLVDHRLTRRLRARRDETLPFAQAQVTRAWWTLLATGCLGTLGMALYGGGSMIYVMWIVLLGLGMYLFGLFSRPIIEWIGLAMMLIGVMMLATDLSIGVSRWLCASCYAIGMPLAGWLDRWLERRSLSDAGRPTDFRHRDLPLVAAAVIAWTAIVVSLPLLPLRWLPTQAPAGAIISLPIDAGATVQGERVLRLARGTRVPLFIDLDSSLLAISPSAQIDMALLQPIEIASGDGQPDGRYRIADGPWHAMRDGVMRVRIDRLTPTVGNEGPQVRMHGRIDQAEPGVAGR